MHTRSEWLQMRGKLALSKDTLENRTEYLKDCQDVILRLIVSVLLMLVEDKIKGE